MQIPSSRRVKPTRCNVSQFIYFCKMLYMFQTVFPSIIRSSKLHIQRQVHVFVRPILLPAASSDSRAFFQFLKNFNSVSTKRLFRNGWWDVFCQAFTFRSMKNDFNDAWISYMLPYHLFGLIILLLKPPIGLSIAFLFFQYSMSVNGFSKFHNSLPHQCPLRK